jgi:hypothetical protein
MGASLSSPFVEAAHEGIFPHGRLELSLRVSEGTTSKSEGFPDFAMWDRSIMANLKTLKL